MKMKFSCAHATILNARIINDKMVDLYILSTESRRDKETGQRIEEETKINVVYSNEYFAKNAFRLVGARIALDGVIKNKQQNGSDKVFTNFYVENAEITSYPQKWKELGEQQQYNNAPQYNGHGQPNYQSAPQQQQQNGGYNNARQ
ncbi:hypothetical protein VCHA53O466_140114 [Vibrio chagasii]|nr:hypothetical protein VCHA53O466_140114 [Vibrio chagasii]